MSTSASSSGWLVDEQGQWYMQHGHWIARVDPASQSVYYQDLRSHKTQWETPGDWSIPCAPSRKPKKLPARCLDFSHRAARCQVDPDTVKKTSSTPEGAGEFNIWYGRWVGELWNEHHNDGPSPYRCCSRKDSGFTKASLEGSGTRYFCIFFAKGCCHLGAECGYLHRVPREDDAKHITLSHDVFGRDRHRDHNSTMSGVGSIEKDCRTLYVGNINCRRPQTEQELWEEFGEWGEVERINIIRLRNIAFVTYKQRINCEFGKVAMNSQQLGGHTLMNVRWAYDDPNPKAQLKRLHEAQSDMLTALEDQAAYGPDIPAAKRLAPSTEGSVTGPYPGSSAPCVVDEEVDSILKKEEAVVQLQQESCSRLDGIFRRLEESNQQCAETESTDEPKTYVIGSAYTLSSTPSPKEAASKLCDGLISKNAENAVTGHQQKPATVGILVTAVSSSEKPVVNKADPTMDPFRMMMEKK